MKHSGNLVEMSQEGETGQTGAVSASKVWFGLGLLGHSGGGGGGGLGLGAGGGVGLGLGGRGWVTRVAGAVGSLLGSSRLRLLGLGG